MKTRWTHSMCLECWNDKNPGHEPAVMKDPDLETCCYCGKETRDGIYVRDSPTIHSAEFIESVTLEIFDLDQSNKWIPQDPSKFSGLDDILSFIRYMKQRGFPVKFSYEWVLEDQSEDHLSKR